MRLALARRRPESSTRSWPHVHVGALLGSHATIDRGDAAPLVVPAIYVAPGLMQCSKPAGYSITSSARAYTVAGTSRSSDLAALRLRTSWYFVGVCTGRSAGFSPLRTRST